VCVFVVRQKQLMEMVRVLFSSGAGTIRPQIKIRNDVRRRKNDRIKRY